MSQTQEQLQERKRGEPYVVFDQRENNYDPTTLGSYTVDCYPIPHLTKTWQVPQYIDNHFFESRPELMEETDPPLTRITDYKRNPTLEEINAIYEQTGYCQLENIAKNKENTFFLVFVVRTPIGVVGTLRLSLESNIDGVANPKAVMSLNTACHLKHSDRDYSEAIPILYQAAFEQGPELMIRGMRDHLKAMKSDLHLFDATLYNRYQNAIEQLEQCPIIRSSITQEDLPFLRLAIKNGWTFNDEAIDGYSESPKSGCVIGIERTNWDSNWQLTDEPVGDLAIPRYVKSRWTINHEPSEEARISTQLEKLEKSEQFQKFLRRVDSRGWYKTDKPGVEKYICGSLFKEVKNGKIIALGFNSEDDILVQEFKRIAKEVAGFEFNNEVEGVVKTNHRMVRVIMCRPKGSEE